MGITLYARQIIAAIKRRFKKEVQRQREITIVFDAFSPMVSKMREAMHNRATLRIVDGDGITELAYVTSYRYHDNAAEFTLTVDDSARHYQWSGDK